MLLLKGTLHVIRLELSIFRGSLRPCGMHLTLGYTDRQGWKSRALAATPGWFEQAI